MSEGNDSSVPGTENKAGWPSRAGRGMFYQTRRIVKNRKKIEQGRSGLLLPQLQGAGCDTKNVGVSKDIWREREQINLPSESQPGFGAPPVLGGIPAPSLTKCDLGRAFCHPEPQFPCL